MSPFTGRHRRLGRAARNRPSGPPCAGQPGAPRRCGLLVRSTSGIAACSIVTPKALAASGHGERRRPLSPIHIPPVAELDHQDAQRAVVDVADQPVITHSIPPEGPQRRTRQGPAQTARIFMSRQPLAQERGAPSGFLRIEFAELLGGCRGELNPPGQADAPRRPSRRPAPDLCVPAPSSPRRGRSP